jgi:hypothetical protein
MNKVLRAMHFYSINLLRCPWLARNAIWKAHHAVNNHPINIAKAPKASKITFRLNLRIRRSYACAQLVSWPKTEDRLARSFNPLAFTRRLYQTEEPRYSSNVFRGRKQFFACHQNTEKYSRCNPNAYQGPLGTVVRDGVLFLASQDGFPYFAIKFF